MPYLQQPLQRLAQRLRSIGTSTAVFASDVMNGLLAVSHNSLALFGLAVVAAVVVVGSRHDMRTLIEEEALDWLLTRQEARLVVRQPSVDDAPVNAMTLLAVERATAADPSVLDRQQTAVATWLSRRYHVALEPISALVQEAWKLGRREELDPTVILAVMAIESSFNPFAQSAVGAQGLMQVLTRVHDEKYEAFGGNHAAFDPLTNLRVGVTVLKECIAKAGGTLEGGLRFYVGAANLPDDGGYAQKVLGEAQWLRDVAKGRDISPTVKSVLTAGAETPPTPATSNARPVSIAPAGKPGSVPTASRTAVQPLTRESDRLALLR